MTTGSDVSIKCGIAIFARMGSRPIPRVTRMMDVAKGLGYEPLFLSARREAELPETEIYAGHHVRRIGPFFPLLNGQDALLYIRSVAGYNVALFRELRRLRPTLIHCSDFETLPGAVLARAFSKSKLIYNIHDNLAQRYHLPGPVRFLLNMLEGLAVRLSSVALVPEEFRRSALPRWCRRKVRIVRNTPADTGVRAAPPIDGPIRIFFGGWLDHGRGLRQLLRIAQENDDIELTLAGEGAPALVEELRSAPRTRYLGFLTHEEIMAETARSHVVAALYDPKRPINRYAASNKLAEALACGRPVLVNSEMLITESLSGHECLIKLPYSEVFSHGAAKLRNVVRQGQYPAMCSEARRAYEDLYAWDAAWAAMASAISE